jgi:hypothetical protein
MCVAAAGTGRKGPELSNALETAARRPETTQTDRQMDGQTDGRTDGGDPHSTAATPQRRTRASGLGPNDDERSASP